MRYDEFMKGYENTIKILDTLPLPDPIQGEDIEDYMNRVEDMYVTLELPKEFEGYLFNFMSTDSFGDYLHDHRGYYIECCTHYHIWKPKGEN